MAMPLIKPPRPPLATTFKFDGDHAIRLVKGLRCPNCQREFMADDVGTDLGGVVITCSGCDLQILAVSLSPGANGFFSRAP
jgi:hypothetical protein